jgi:NTP pyrophosphatase (non-canonical NTP hydrolase)
MPGAPHRFAIGSHTWPGLSKLNEECGENVQVVGKLMAFPSGEHPDGAGPLSGRLEDELGDLMAAIQYVAFANDKLDASKIVARAQKKLALFKRWHEDERARNED